MQEAIAQFERELRTAGRKEYQFRLYVAGATVRSLQAIENTKRMCETYLKGRYRLEVIDIYQKPELAKGEQIVAAPTLIQHRPAPLRRFIGSMTDIQSLLRGLEFTAPQRPT